MYTPFSLFLSLLLLFDDFADLSMIRVISDPSSSSLSINHSLSINGGPGRAKKTPLSYVLITFPVPPPAPP